MRKIQFVNIFFVVIISLIFSSALWAMDRCKYQETMVACQGRRFLVLCQYYPKINKTFRSLIKLDVRGGWEQFIQNPTTAYGLVEAIRVPYFFRDGSDAVVFTRYEGSAGFLDYELCSLGFSGLRVVKSETGIPEVVLKIQNGIILLWSGVRLWVVYCPEGRFAVKELVPFVRAEKIGDKVNDRVVEFQIRDGAVVFADPSVAENGLRIKKGHDLLFQRTDDGPLGEKIDFSGKIISERKFPCVWRIYSGVGEIRISPEGYIPKERIIRLVTVD